jgi:enoyl-CoA hydratase
LIETGALLNARQAISMGLVQEVVPAGTALERALAIASAMSTYPQGAIRNDRRAALEGFTLSLDEGLAHEAAVHRETANDPAMAAWLARFAKGERPEPIRPPER